MHNRCVPGSFSGPGDETSVSCTSCNVVYIVHVYIHVYGMLIYRLLVLCNGHRLSVTSGGSHLESMVNE